MARGLLLVLCCSLAAACACSLLLLPAPAQAARPAAAGPAAAAGGGRDHQQVLPEPPRFFDASAEVPYHFQPKEEVMRRGGVPAWSSWSAGPAELRSVPGGPDPLHHHASPRRPEQQQGRSTPSSSP